MRVNGAVHYSIYTDLSAHASVGSIKIEDNISRNSTWVDDIVINDTRGTRNNSWPGPGHVYGIKPNAVGSNSGLTPFPGTGEHNYEDVDETPNDGYTTYVASNLSGTRDTYNFEPLGDSGPIRGVAVHTISKLEVGDDLASGIKAVALYGGTYDKKTAPALTTSYTRRGQPHSHFRGFLGLSGLSGLLGLLDQCSASSMVVHRKVIKVIRVI